MFKKLLCLALLSIFSVSVYCQKQTVFPTQKANIICNDPTTGQNIKNFTEPLVYGATTYCAAMGTDPQCASAFYNTSDMTYGFVETRIPDYWKSFAINDYLQSPMHLIVFRNDVPVAKMQYYLQVDKYSLLEVLGSNSSALFDPYHDADPTHKFTQAEIDEIMGVEMAVEFRGFTTSRIPRAYFAQAIGILTDVFPKDRNVALYYSVMINIKDGNVIGIEWDNSCMSCPGNLCKKGVCYSPMSDCNTDKNINTTPDKNDKTQYSDVSCSAKVYVAWKGKDKNGFYALSADQTIQSFTQFSPKIAFDEAAKTAKQIVSGVNIGDIKIPTDIVIN